MGRRANQIVILNVEDFKNKHSFLQEMRNNRTDVLISVFFVIERLSFSMNCTDEVIEHIITAAELTVLIIEVSSSDTSADLLPDHTCRGRYIVVSVFTVTCSIILIGYVSSLLCSLYFSI